MIKKSLLKTFPGLTDKHIRLYGAALFFLGALYLMYGLILLICYLPAGGLLLRGALLFWLGSSLSEKKP